MTQDLASAIQDFLFSALNIVKPFDFDGDIDVKIAELEAKRKELDDA